MKDKIKNYVGNILEGLGIFLNTIIGGDTTDSIFSRIWEMLLDARDSILELFNKK